MTSATTPAGVKRNVLRNAVLLSLSCVPLFVAIAHVAIHGQPVPLADEWHEPIDNAIRAKQGVLTFADLLRQYNDTRPLMTNLVTVASTHLLSWDLKAEMYLNVILSAVTLMFFYLICQRHLGEGALWVLPLLSLSTFSLTQRTNWLWAIQSQYFFLFMFFAAALYALDRGKKTIVRWRSVLAASVLSLAMTFSYANGQLAWFILPGVMWWRGYRQRAFYAYWLAAMAAALTAYYHGYVFEVLERGFSFDLVLHARFVLGMLGSALTAHTGLKGEGRFDVIASLGGLGLCLFVLNAVLLARHERYRSVLATWVGLAVFVLVSIAVISLARAPTQGLPGALAGRYVTLTMMFWIALVAVGAQSVRACQTRAAPGAMAGAALVANLTSGVLLAAWLVRADLRITTPAKVTASHRVCFEAAPKTRDVTCLHHLHQVFDPAHPSFAYRHLALAKIDQLSELRLSVFAPAR